MKKEHDVQHCRWAEPTLFLEAPRWLDAWEYPWSCQCKDEYHPIEDTRVCPTCPRWKPREGDREI